MKKLFFLLFALIRIADVYSQGCSFVNFYVAPSPNSTPKKDTSVCKSSSLTLYASSPSLKLTTSYTVQPITYYDTLPCESIGSLVAGSGINQDDYFSSVQNLGFNFCFYGNAFRKIIISDNGYISFDSTKALQPSLEAAGNLPTTPRAPNNTIYGAMMDVLVSLDPAYLPVLGGGTISVQQVGVAPFRAYIVKYSDCKYYKSSPNNPTCRPNAAIRLNMKIVLYETTNMIDVYIKTKPLCHFNSLEPATQGLYGNNATQWITTPGRNAQLWVGDSTAFRYLPNGSGNVVSYIWKKNGVVVGNSSTLNINPIEDSAVYSASSTIVSSCPLGTVFVGDSITVYGLNNVIVQQDIFDTIKCVDSITIAANTNGAIKYFWDNNSKNINRKVGATGIYKFIRYYDSTGCTRDTLYYRIFKALKPKIDSIQRTGCFNATNSGQVKIFTSGETLGLLYGESIYPTSSSNTITNQSNGLKKYYVQNQFGCVDSASYIHNALIAAFSKRVNYCTVDSSGMMKLTTTGGNTPYLFSLTGRLSQSIDSFNKITSGIYTIGVTDKNGCSISQIDTIIPYTTLSLNIIGDSVRCNGANTGKITALLSGGVSPYDYSINSGSFVGSGTFNNLIAGVYSIKTKDSKNCPIDTLITIYQNAAITASISSTKTCPTTSTASATIVASNGSPGYTYQLNSGSFQSSNLFSSMPNTNFTITVKDALNCTKSFSDSILPFPKLNVSILSKSNLTCYQSNDGKIKVMVTNGTSPYTYVWSNSATYDSTIFLSMGNYTVTVTDANNCKDIITTTITQPDTVVASFNLYNPLCSGQANGRIKTIGSGGTSPYTYSFNGGAYSSTDSFFNLTPNSYSITVKDVNSCTKSYNQSISSPLPITATYKVDSARCFGDNSGKITVTASGGTGLLSYKKDGINQPNDTIKNLSAGTYIVRVYDINNCFIDSSRTVYQYPDIAYSNTKTNVVCYGNSTGSITANASGGNGGFQYQLNAGGFSNTNIFNSLNAGIYTIKFKDNNQCTKLKIDTISQIDSMTFGVFKIQNKCNKDSLGLVRLSITGATAPYQFSFNGSAFTTVDSLYKIPASTVNYTVRDANMCTKSSSTIITQPTPIQISIQADSVRCFKGNTGKITISALGGTPGYQYSINSGSYGASNIFNTLTKASYYLKISDNNLCIKDTNVLIHQPDSLYVSYTVDSLKCNNQAIGKVIITPFGGKSPYTYNMNGGSFGTSNIFSSLGPGTYSFVTKDYYNCTFTFNVTLFNPTAITYTLDNIVQNKCNNDANGIIKITSSGGKMPHTYSWSNGKTNPMIQNLVANNYAVTITDDNGCTKLDNFNITHPSAISYVTTKYDLKCNGDLNGWINDSAIGGTPPFVYSWVGNSSTSKLISNIGAGSYKVNVVDNNLCTSSHWTTLFQPNVINYNLTKTNSHCKESNDGTITIQNLTGGTSPFTYNWSNGSNQSFVNGLTSLKKFYVSVTDFNNCSRIDSSFIDTLYKIRANVSFTTPRCTYSKIDVNVTPLNGSSLFDFYLGSDSVKQSNLGIFNQIRNGIYTLKFIDKYNCNFDSIVDMKVKDSMKASFINYNPTCTDGNIFNAKYNVSGGYPPYVFDWQGSWKDFGDSAQYNLSGRYTVTVKDQWCQLSKTFNLKIPEFQLQGTIDKTNLKCYQIPEGKMSAIGLGGTPPYSYKWSNGDTTMNSTKLKANTNYTVTITDDNNCKFIISDNLSEPRQLTFNLNPINVSCPNRNDGMIIIRPDGGTIPHGLYKASIDSGKIFQYTSHFSGLKPGHYPIIVKDENDCEAKGSADLILINSILLNLDSVYKMDLGSSVQLFPIVNVNSTNTNIEYLWKNDLGLNCTDCLNPIYSGYISRQITLVVRYGDNCIDTINSNIIVDVTNTNFYVPNAMTYNNQKAENNVLKAYGNFISKFKMMIFNRWGEKVFESDNIDKGWDGMYKGEYSPIGNYNYVIEAITLDKRVIKRNGAFVIF